MNKIQVVYTSKASSDVDDAQILDIHTRALGKNAQEGITGMLLYTKGTFLQVIEGEADAIDCLMAKIKSDKRHCNVEVLVRNSIKQREFKNWSMGYHRLEDADTKALANFAPFFEDGFNAVKFCQQAGSSLEILRVQATQIDQNSERGG